MTRRMIVVVTAIVAVVVFLGAWFAHDRIETQRQIAAAAAISNTLVRQHAPVIGPVNAPVTIVEFFDPSCESCRAFYPYVKQILAAFPKDVRLVIRYAAFHDGSEEAIRILETARLQNVFEPVIEVLMARQPIWAAHGRPNLDRAWEFARTAGLDVERAQRDKARPEIDHLLKQDAEDIKTAEVRGTPTFFVNGKPLLSFGPQPLYELVREEVARVSGGR